MKFCFPIFQRCKGEAMHGCGAEPLEGGEVCWSAVAFVESKPVTGVLSIEIAQDGIPAGFCQDGGRGDA